MNAAALGNAYNTLEIQGEAGDDTLTAGSKDDTLGGGDGDDRLEVRNGAADSAQGGSGTDSAVVDLADTVVDVESVDRPARALARIGRKAQVALRGGKPVAIVSVSCPAGAERSCAGVLRLSSAKAIRIGGIKVRVDLGGRRYEVAPGETAQLRVNLPAKARSLARRGKLLVRAVISAKEGDAVTQSARTLTLKFPRR